MVELLPAAAAGAGNRVAAPRLAHVAQGQVVERDPTPRRKTHCAQGCAAQGERPDGDWRKTQFAQGVIPGLLARGGDAEQGQQRGPAGGYSVSHREAGNRVATSSVRPAAVADGLPERVEAAAPLSMFNSHAAAVRQRPELVSFRSSRRMKIAKPAEPLRRVDPIGEGIRDAVLFL